METLDLWQRLSYNKAMQRGNTKEIISSIVDPTRGIAGKLILCQGASGSGKSTFMGKLATAVEEVTGVKPRVHENDDFFMQKDGTYHWDAGKIMTAVKDCEYRVRTDCENCSYALVSNTFTESAHIAPYASIAEEFGLEFIVVRMCGDYGNVHNVPEEVVKKQRQKLARALRYEPTYVVDDKHGVVTRHYTEERGGRQDAVDELGEGKVMYRCLVDKGHRDGKEWHAITDTAMILITNAVSGRYITSLIARPGQLRRYEEGWYGQVERVEDVAGKVISNLRLPRWLFDKARAHQRDGYNFR